MADGMILAALVADWQQLVLAGLVGGAVGLAAGLALVRAQARRMRAMRQAAECLMRPLGRALSDQAVLGSDIPVLGPGDDWARTRARLQAALNEAQHALALAGGEGTGEGRSQGTGLRDAARPAAAAQALPAAPPPLHHGRSGTGC